MFFDRHEMHTQAFLDFIKGNLAFFDPHLRKIIVWKYVLEFKLFYTNMYSDFQKQNGT